MKKIKDYYDQIKSKELYNIKEREEKARNILFTIKKFLKEKIKNLDCLDVGCSNGIITSYLSNNFSKTIGIDVDEKAIDYAKTNYKIKKLKFTVASGEDIPFPDGSFDVIICNYVYSYTKNPQRLIDELYRVLRENGICYFSGVNRLAIIDQHYGLPFLSWLPKYLSNLYLKITKRGLNYNKINYHYFKFLKLFKKFNVYNYTAQIIKNKLDLPLWFIKLFTLFYPSYIFILKKPIYK